MSSSDRRCAVLLMVVIALIAGPASAQVPGSSAKPDAGRLAAAQRLLRASEAADLMITAMKANIPAQRAAMPQVPTAFWERFEQRIVSDAPELLDSIVVLYATMVTLQEREQLSAVYESPVGRRLRDAQPELVTRSSQIGQRWGARLGAAVAATLER